MSRLRALTRHPPSTLRQVLTAYPKYVRVGRLPGLDDAQRLDVARALVEARAVLVKQSSED